MTEFERLKEQYGDTLPDKEIKRKIWLDAKYPNGRVGLFTNVNFYKKSIHSYNFVINVEEKSHSKRSELIQQLIMTRDISINALNTEYLKLGVPNDLLPDREYLKNV